MLHKTQGIVLRSVKYGESSLVTTIFTAHFGIQSYMVKGVRSSKAKQNKTGLLQPGILLDLVVYRNPQKNLQHISEYQTAYFYKTLQENIVKNSILLFSIELLLRLLPEDAPADKIFGFAMEYFISLDQSDMSHVANYPLFFILNCSTIMGYELNGNYSEKTPYLDLIEGGFVANSGLTNNALTNEDIISLDKMLRINDIEQMKLVSMNGNTRFKIIDWYIYFLQQHTQHMGNIRSLTVLQSILR